jgi:ubiquinone biosynthesis protein
MGMQTIAAPRVGWFDTARRFQQVGFVLAKHGFGEIVARIGLGVPHFPFGSQGRSQHQRFAKRLAATFEELGPTYVKLGQSLATRADLFPPEIIVALSALHSSVRPMPLSRVLEVIEKGLGRSYTAAFRSFERECLAAASIAQVHRATLHDGCDVAVKVQRPGLERMVQADLAIMRRLAELLAQRVAEVASYDPVGLVEAFARTIRQELDFRVEAQNARRLREALQGSSEVLIPRVHEQLTTKHVLVMEYAPGMRIDLLAPPARARVREVLLNSFVRQTIDFGIFHADPHPGNMLVHHDGRVILLDFGAIDVLERPLRRKLSRFTRALAMNRSGALCESVIAIAGGSRAEHIDRERMQRDVALLLDATSEGKATRIVDQMFAMSRAHGLRLPPALFALMRATALLDGVLRSLAPGRDVVRDLRREFLWATMRCSMRTLSQPWHWLRSCLHGAMKTWQIVRPNATPVLAPGDAKALLPRGQ